MHILRNEEELEAAIARASEFDRRIAATLQSRFRHYEAIVAVPARVRPQLPAPAPASPPETARM